MEIVLTAILSVLQSTWFWTLIGGLLLPQPVIVQRVWGFVMGARSQLDRVAEIVDTVDAMLKANGIIPTDAPKVSAQDVQAVLEGKSDPEIVFKAHRAKLAKR